MRRIEMSNDKNVWISIPNDYRFVNIYTIGMNIPNRYDYPAYRQAQLEYYSDTANKDKAQKVKNLGEYGWEIENQIGLYKQFKALPDGLWTEDENELPDLSEYIFRVKGGGLIMNEVCANIFK